MRAVAQGADALVMERAGEALRVPDHVPRADPEPRLQPARQPQGRAQLKRETRQWEHTWTDTLQPGHFHVWKGAWLDGKIDLLAEWDDEDGRPVRSRLTWSDITADSAHWESSRSSDGGKTWQLHWVIDLRRRR